MLITFKSVVRYCNGGFSNFVTFPTIPLPSGTINKHFGKLVFVTAHAG